jgi:plastocyanin
MTNMKIAAILLMPSLVVASFYALSASPLPAATPASAAAPAASDDTTISIRDFMFSPMSLTVTAGTTVNWKNLDAEPHTVHGVDTNFRSNAMDQNETFAYKFDQPGTYRYVCSIHPQMLGTIIVKAAGTAH